MTVWVDDWDIDAPWLPWASYSDPVGVLSSLSPLQSGPGALERDTGNTTVAHSCFPGEACSGTATPRQQFLGIFTASRRSGAGCGMA